MYLILYGIQIMPLGRLKMIDSFDSLLIVGGTGFIGHHFAKKAVDKGYDVSIISLHHPNLEEVIESVKYYQVNICNYKDIEKKISNNKFEYVVNLGGYVDHSDYSEGGSQVIDSHYRGVINVINFIDWHTLKNFIQVGSSDEYGQNPAPQNELMREEPISPYSFAKVSINHFLQMLGRTEKFPSVILRLFLVYGPGQKNDRFIPKIIKGCLNNEVFKTSHGNQSRDFCHIDDIINGIFCALLTRNLFGEIINLASGRPVKIKYVINFIQNMVGGGRPQFGKVPYRLNENMTLYADINKSKEILSWRPVKNLEDSLKDLINIQS
jgi:nucleoside-diphosphate-sugar epimerase